MDELEMKVKPLEDMKERLVECSKAELMRGVESVDTEEMGDAIDMVKDLSEAIKCCYEAHYFKAVIEAMQGRGGYTMNGGTPLNGFRAMPAPMGDMVPQMLNVGRRDDYNIGDSEWDQMTASMPWVGYRMGYNGSSRSGNSSGGSGSSGGNSGSGGMSGGGRSGYGRDVEWNPRYGEAYNKFRESRKHYQFSRQMEDKKEMNEHMSEHVMDTIATIREMWQDADPELRKKMKSDFEMLLKEMNT